MEHALGYLEALPLGPFHGVDLGSGGGVPGLVLAMRTPHAHWTLLESQQRRSRFLLEAVQRLEVGRRVAVYAGRTERAGRDVGHRGAYDVAVARSFGPPPVTAEAAAPLLRPGGVLVVSEPPEAAAERWPQAGLAQLGLRAESAVETSQGHYQVLRQVERCDGRFPRREGVATRRPLF